MAGQGAEGIAVAVGDFVKFACEAGEVMFSVNVGMLGLVKFCGINVTAVLAFVEALSCVVMLIGTVRFLILEGIGLLVSVDLYEIDDKVNAPPVGNREPAVKLAATEKILETSPIAVSLTTIFTIADASFKRLATIDTMLRPLEIPIETSLLLS